MNGPRDEHEAQARQQLLSSLMDGDADASTTLEACAAWRGDPKARADWHAYHVIGDVLRTPELTPARGGDAAFVQVLRARLAAEPVVMAPGVPGAVLPASTHEQPSSDPWGLSAAGAVAAPVNARTARARPNDGWRVPAAVAAGVFAVATVVLVTRSPAPQESTVATAPVAIQPQAIVAADATRAPTTATATAPATATSLAAAPELAGAPSTPATRVAASPGESASAGDVTREARVLRDSRVDRALDRYMTAHRQFGSSAMPSMPGGVVRSVSISAPDR